MQYVSSYSKFNSKSKKTTPRSQSGDLSGGCLSAGPHFNPYGKTHGAPTDRVRHVGDLGNIQSDQSGVAEFSISDKLITLYGPNSVVG